MSSEAEPTGTRRISEYSRQFYNGAIKWTTDGFTDANGVFQAWGDEPHNRPPTPGGLSDLSDSGSQSVNGDHSDERGADSEVNVAHRRPEHSNGKPFNAAEAVVPQPSFSKLIKTVTDGPQQDSVETLAAKLKATKSSKGAIPQQGLVREDLFSDRPDAVKQRCIGRAEGILIGQFIGAGLNLEDSYQRVGLDFPNELAKEAAKTDASALPRLEGALQHNSEPETTRDNGMDQASPLTQANVVSKPHDEAAGQCFTRKDSASFDLDEVAKQLDLGPDANQPRKEAEFSPRGGRREANSTPVNATPAQLSTSPLDRRNNNVRRSDRGKKRINGEASESESSSDDEKEKKLPRSDHDDSKKRKKKDDEEDDEDEGAGGDNESGDKRESKEARKDSKAETNSRKSSQANQAGSGAGTTTHGTGAEEHKDAEDQEEPAEVPEKAKASAKRRSNRGQANFKAPKAASDDESDYTPKKGKKRTPKQAPSETTVESRPRRSVRQFVRDSKAQSKPKGQGGSK
ncbi:hypothetical protein BCR34DRAFT_365265 [Clohesyomyces aquaticus]|uniref:Uncharacterized protein n=1 Tax=Clohesyomyces aquaticus TaxID=1231657 RepID=A0A1Y1ZHJ4_9PLEO|nr:hypothetical protein BCR34DRAFT_365265 [Clohesyomyces aquaticus]